MNRRCIVLVTLCYALIAPIWAWGEAGIEGELVFQQDGSDLLITGKGWTTRGVYIVQTDWYEKSKDEIVLIYTQVYNKETVKRSITDIQVTWRLKNITKGQQKFRIAKTVVFLTPEELRTLLGVESKAKEQSQPPAGGDGKPAPQP